MARKRRMTREERAAQDVGRLLSTPEGRKLALVLLVVALLAWGIWWIWQRQHRPTAAPAAMEASQVRIATWNLRKFSERAAPDLVAIAKLIKENRFDLVAIQEVQQQGQAAQRLRRQLNEPWRLEVSDMAGDGERFAYLYRADRLELIGEPRLLDGPEAAIFARRPYTATFRSGAFDFTLITVHASYTDAARRREEIEALAAHVDRLAEGAEKDILILGDFNEQQSRPNLHYFSARGWRPANAQPTNLGSTEIYDNILLNPRFTREWTQASGVVRFDEQLYANNDKLAADDVSDHRPVWADFATAGPDDD